MRHRKAESQIWRQTRWKKAQAFWRHNWYSWILHFSLRELPKSYITKYLKPRRTPLPQQNKQTQTSREPRVFPTPTQTLPQAQIHRLNAKGNPKSYKNPQNLPIPHKRPSKPRYAPRAPSRASPAPCFVGAGGTHAHKRREPAPPSLLSSGCRATFPLRPFVDRRARDTCSQ